MTDFYESENNDAIFSTKCPTSLTFLAFLKSGPKWRVAYICINVADKRWFTPFSDHVGSKN
jgi:hypothetical protein